MMNARWNLDRLSQAPTVYPAPGLEVDGVRALFFEALPWRGKPTRTFAYLGFPDGAKDEKVPGIVLVHGGGGTAYVDWVRLWTARGYAALAMDTCGGVPHDVPEIPIPRSLHHDQGGPPGWGGFDQIDEPEEDQWIYHAVADVLLGCSLLGAQPEIDAGRIGITGISWGGFLTCIAAGIDDRFRFAAPIYGCGFTRDNVMWKADFERMGAVGADKWMRLWDPSHYLPEARMPFLWVNGTNDPAFPLDSYQKSYRLPQGLRTLSLKVRMVHAHGGPGEKPEEIRAFADHLLRGGRPLAQLSNPSFDGVRLSVHSSVPIVKAELTFTRQSGPWSERLWETLPAEIDANCHQACAAVPGEALLFYLNLTDEQGLVVSSEHSDRAALS
jgi:dienelactone hydrolase